jgi:hypothetical protein
MFWTPGPPKDPTGSSHGVCYGVLLVFPTTKGVAQSSHAVSAPEDTSCVVDPLAMVEGACERSVRKVMKRSLRTVMAMPLTRNRRYSVVNLCWDEDPRTCKWRASRVVGCTKIFAGESHGGESSWAVFQCGKRGLSQILMAARMIQNGCIQISLVCGPRAGIIPNRGINASRGSPSAAVRAGSADHFDSKDRCTRSMLIRTRLEIWRTKDDGSRNQRRRNEPRHRASHSQLGEPCVIRSH